MRCILQVRAQEQPYHREACGPRKQGTAIYFPLVPRQSYLIYKSAVTMVSSYHVDKHGDNVPSVQLVWNIRIAFHGRSVNLFNFRVNYSCSVSIHPRVKSFQTPILYIRLSSSLYNSVTMIHSLEGDQVKNCQQQRKQRIDGIKFNFKLH